MKTAVCSTLKLDQVRVVSRLEDPHHGLKGHDYIKARQLNQPVQKLVQTSAQKGEKK